MTKNGIVLCIVAAMSGVVVGAWVAFRFTMGMADVGVLTRAEADLAVGTRILQSLHSGEWKVAKELLETQLDGALITIDAYASQGAKLEPKTYERLEQIKRIRNDSAYQPSDPLVATTVERALRLRAADTE
jgi:hypothetical protein